MVRVRNWGLQSSVKNALKHQVKSLHLARKLSYAVGSTKLTKDLWKRFVWVTTRNEQRDQFQVYETYFVSKRCLQRHLEEGVEDHSCS